MYFEYLFYLLALIIIFLYFKKKFRKYNDIYKINGLDGIYFYFLNKNFTDTGFSNFIDKKKNILGNKIASLSKGKILFGLYKGTKIINSFSWSNSQSASKYLGLYENVVQNKIIKICKKFKLETFIDLGAAEGFHIISLLNKNYFLNGIAYEIDKNSRSLIKKNASINNISKKISIFGEAKLETIENSLKSVNLKKTLFLVDIEGNEFYLFNNKFCKKFSKSFFIIEDHNFNIKKKNISNKFYKNIKKYFKVEIIKDNVKNPFEYKILDKFTDDEKYLMMSEGRPKTMNWIILAPKKK